MITRIFRPLVMSLVPVGLTACISSPPVSAEQSAEVPLGIDLGGSGPVIASAQPQLLAHATHAEAPKQCQQPRQFTGKIALGGRGANRVDLI